MKTMIQPGLIVAAALVFLSVVGAPTAIGAERPWLGFGFNQYPLARDRVGADQAWSEADWDMTFQRVAALSPGLVRVNVYRSWFNSDAAGQPLPVGRYRWDAPPFQAYCRVLRWYQSRGVPVLSGFWNAGFYQKVDASFCTSSGPNSFAQLQVDLLTHLRDVEKITCVRWYTPLNEPAGMGISPADYAEIIRRTHEAFAAAGLDTGLMAADAWDEWTADAARRVGPLLAGYEHHKYLNDGQTWLRESGFERYLRRIDADAAAADHDHAKPIILGEGSAEDVDRIDWWFRTPPAPEAVTPINYACAVATLDYAAQVLRSGHSGALLWCLDGFDMEKDSGLWKLDGSEAGRVLRPKYYAWWLASRGFPAGATITALDAPPGVHVAKAVWPDNVSILYVNRNGIVVGVDLPSTPASSTLRKFEISQQSHGDGHALTPSSTPVAPPASGGLHIDLPANGAVLLTTVTP